MSLWAFVCSVLLCTLWVKEQLRDSLESFFSHRTHRFNRAFLRTVSISQNAFGIQSSQSVTAKEGCWVIVVRCWWLAIGVSRWSLPSLRGRGRGRGQLGTGSGPLSFWTLCVLFICVNLWERKLFFVREGNVVCERRKTNYANRKCKDISQTILLFFQIKAGLDARRGLSTFENMAFLFHEGRLLQARRAYTQMLNVIRWFLVGYMLGCKWWCLLVLR